MNFKYKETDKESIVKRHLINGESVAGIVADTGIPRSTVYNWIKNYTEKSSRPQVSLRYVQNIEKKVKRVEGIIEILKKSECSVSDSLKIKLPVLEELHGQYSVHMLCEALEVPRGTFYNHMLRNKKDSTWYAKRKEELRVKIQRIYDDNNQIFGAGKIYAIMKDEGYHTSVEMVRSLMRNMGLYSIRNGAKSLFSAKNLFRIFVCRSHR